jgi:hypothetical protein
MSKTSQTLNLSEISKFPTPNYPVLVLEQKRRLEAAAVPKRQSSTALVATRNPSTEGINGESRDSDKNVEKRGEFPWRKYQERGVLR